MIMVKTIKIIIIFSVISMFCLIGSVYGGDHQEKNEVRKDPNSKSMTSSNVVVLYDDRGKSSYSDIPLLFENKNEQTLDSGIGHGSASVQRPEQAKDHKLNEVKPTPVPEPGIYVMLLAGIGLLVLRISLKR